MSLATFATFIGVVELMISLPILVHPEKATSWLVSMLDHDVLMRILGTLFAALGVTILVQDASIGTDTAGLMRLVVWLLVLKGVMFAWFPQIGRSISEKFMDIAALQFLAALMGILLGVLFIVAGNQLA